MLRLDLIGNLGHDPDSKYTPQGKMVTTVSVGVSVGWGDNQRTEWIKATLWEKSAEFAHKAMQKGTTVWLSGTPKLSTWNSKDGDAKGQIELTVKEFKILKGGRPKEEAEEDNEEIPGFMQA